MLIPNHPKTSTDYYPFHKPNSPHARYGIFTTDSSKLCHKRYDLCSIFLMRLIFTDSTLSIMTSDIFFAYMPMFINHRKGICVHFWCNLTRTALYFQKAPKTRGYSFASLKINGLCVYIAMCLLAQFGGVSTSVTSL